MNTPTTASEKRKQRRCLNNKLADLSNSRPSRTLGEFLKAAGALHPDIQAALEGIWCGREGTEAIVIEGWNAMICLGWYEGKIEWSYIR